MDCFLIFQSPSFLDFQRRMLRESARSNCHSLFGVDRIPGDNHIRNLLDGVDASLLYEAPLQRMLGIQQAGQVPPVLGRLGRAHADRAQFVQRALQLQRRGKDFRAASGAPGGFRQRQPEIGRQARQGLARGGQARLA
ncbi:MAG: hypothetical protein OXT70_12605 [Chloroflexota bacterium]|nr:hypothetical protein [Chloroflexota bacterium]